jgi:hypothetical protein
LLAKNDDSVNLLKLALRSKPVRPGNFNTD